MPESRPTSPPLTGDASVGLDPSADVDHYLEGKRWIPRIDDVTAKLVPTHGHSSHRHHSHNRSRSHSKHRSREHTSANGAAHRAGSRSGTTEPHTDTQPATSTAKGASTRRAKSVGRSKRLSSSEKARDEPPEQSPDPHRPSHPPTGSLTLSFFSPGLSLSRRLSLLGGSMLINLFLPFVNGTMLGIGEAIAHAVIWPTVGIALGAGLRYFRATPAAS